MDDAPAPFDDGLDHPPMPSLVELRAMMERSNREVAAGQVVPAEKVLADIDATIARWMAERGKNPA